MSKKTAVPSRNLPTTQTYKHSTGIEDKKRGERKLRRAKKASDCTGESILPKNSDVPDCPMEVDQSTSTDVMQLNQENYQADYTNLLHQIDSNKPINSKNAGKSVNLISFDVNNEISKKKKIYRCRCTNTRW